MTPQQPFYVAVFSEPVTALQVFSLSGLGLIGLAAVPPIRKNKRLKQALVWGVVVLAAFSVGYFVGLTAAQTGTITIEPGSFTETASYVIWTDGTNVYARNGVTGAIDFKGTDASTVIQAALNALTPNRTWKEKVVLKGNFTISNTIKIPSYTILEVQGKLTLANGVNKNMIENSDRKNGNVEIEICGGKLDGNRAGQTSLSSPISLVKVYGLLIKDVKITKGYEYGIDLIGCERFVLSNIFGDDAGGDDFISIRGDSSWSPGNPPSKYGIVENCISINHSGFLSARGTSDFEVEDGAEHITFTNCKAYAGSNKVGFNIGDPTNNVVKHITLVDCYAENKTERCFGLNGSSAKIMEDIKLIRPIAIGGNYQGIYVSYCSFEISEPYVKGTSAGNGIYVTGNVGGVICGGTVESNAYNGIRLVDASNVCIVGVVVKNNSQISSGTYDGINIGGTSTYNLVANCRIFDDQDTKTQGRALKEADTSNYNMIIGNVVYGNRWTPISKVGVNTIVKRNVGYDTESFKVTGLSVTVGTGGAYGSASAITTLSGMITYPRIKITWGGTFGTGETVTVKVEAVYTDGTTAYVEKSATATGSTWLTDDDIISLITQGKDIVKLNVYAKTNLSSTTVTVTVDAYGKA
jgi:hypothetical protein